MQTPAFWKNMSRRKRHWLINIFWGIAIEIVLIHAHGLPLVEKWQNVALDAVMRANTGPSLLTEDMQKKLSGMAGRPAAAALPLALVEVDDATWRSGLWGGGEPDRAPRQQLLTLIDYALAKGSRFIVLDILVEGRETPDDAWLAKELEQRLASPRWSPEQHLILVRTVRNPLEGDRTAPELRASPLDRVMAKHPGRVHVAAPYFKKSSDDILRDWELWKNVCRKTSPDGAGHWSFVPSVQMLVAALNAEIPLQDLQSPGGSCTVCADAVDAVFLQQQQTEKQLNERIWGWIRLHAGVQFEGEAVETLANRIVYSFGNAKEGMRREGQVTTVRALDVLRGSPLAAGASLQGAVTVIGQTYQECGDFYSTPVGRLPGALILLNSVDSMLNTRSSDRAFQVLTPPGPWMTWPLTLLFIVIVGYAYARWRSVLGTLFATSCGIVLIPLANYMFVKFGVWLDFAAPLLAIQAHRIIASFEEFVEHRCSSKKHIPTQEVSVE